MAAVPMKARDRAGARHVFDDPGIRMDNIHQDFHTQVSRVRSLLYDGKPSIAGACINE
jgi:hypothetical protein